MHAFVAALQQQLNLLPTPKRYVVAYSGGCDSHVLLQGVTQLQTQLACQSIVAIHINHGLQQQAAQWQQHCQQVCQQLDVPLQTFELSLDVPKGESLEAYAREARYAAIYAALQPGDMLLLAQHQDDQAETLLLQLLRGSGVKGLASMSVCTAKDQIWVSRPLLTFTRTQIEDYAREMGLSWVDDPSNQDTQLNRNYLRHEIMPLLQQRWPGVSTVLARSAQHQADADQLLDILAEQDYAYCQTGNDYCLAITPLQQWAPVRIRNVLRYWLDKICQAKTLPSTVQLQRIMDEMMAAAPDANPMVSWAQATVRRYRDSLYFCPEPALSMPQWQVSWDLDQPLLLPSGESIHAQLSQGTGMDMSQVDLPVQVRFRRGGERCRLPGRAHQHELKKLFQDWGIPPWLRDQIPLIFVGETLAHIVGYATCAPFDVAADKSGIDVHLTAAQLPSAH